MDEPRDQSLEPCSPSAPHVVSAWARSDPSCRLNHLHIYKRQRVACLLSRSCSAGSLERKLCQGPAHTCCTCSRKAAGWPGSPRSRFAAGSSAPAPCCSPAPPGPRGTDKMNGAHMGVDRRGRGPGGSCSCSCQSSVCLLLAGQGTGKLHRAVGRGLPHLSEMPQHSGGNRGQSETGNSLCEAGHITPDCLLLPSWEGDKSPAPPGVSRTRRFAVAEAPRDPQPCQPCSCVRMVPPPYLAEEVG